MTAQHCASLFPLAVLGLAVACGDPAGLDRLSSGALPPLADEVFLPNDDGLVIKAAVKVEDVDEESIRELVEIRSLFALEPVDPDASSPAVSDIQLDFEVNPAGGIVPSDIRVAIAGDAWTALDGGDFVIEVEDAQAVHDAVKVEVLEAGDPVAELTGHIAAVEASLRFRPDVKASELILELTGIATPSMIVTPTMFNALAGAASGTLHIREDQVTTAIRENEAGYEAGFLAVKAETKVEEPSPGSLREAVAIHATFPSGELQPDPEVATVEDLQLDFDIDIAGVVGPPCIRVLIDGGAWVQGDGGGFKIEHADGANSTPIHVLVVQDGQIVAELTEHIESVEAGLNFLVNQKRWELTVEIAGIVTPSDVHVARFSPIGGAGRVSVEIGEALELLMAKIREAGGVFGIIIPTD